MGGLGLWKLCLLTLALASIAVPTCLLWSDLTTAAPLHERTSSTVIAYSSTMSTKTTFWLTQEILTPTFADDASFLSSPWNFEPSYRLENPVAANPAITFVLGGPVARELIACDNQQVGIRRDRNFDELPPQAKDAIIASTLGQFGSTFDRSQNHDTRRMIEASQKAQSTRYTTLTITADPAESNRSSGKSPVVVEGGITCEVKQAAIWHHSGENWIVTSPLLAYSSPSSADNELNAYSMISVYPADGAQFSDATAEPEKAINGQLNWTASDESPTDLSGGNEVVCQPSVNARFGPIGAVGRREMKLVVLGALMGAAGAMVVPVVNRGGIALYRIVRRVRRLRTGQQR